MRLHYTIPSFSDNWVYHVVLSEHEPELCQGLYKLAIKQLDYLPYRLTNYCGHSLKLGLVQDPF